MNAPPTLLAAAAGLAALVILPLALAGLLARLAPVESGAALPFPRVDARQLHSLSLAQAPAARTADPVTLPDPPNHQTCLDLRSWILAMHSQTPVVINDDCILAGGRWTGLVTGRTTEDPRNMTVMPAIPLKLAMAAGLQQRRGDLERWISPQLADAWLWIPVRNSATRLRGGRSIEAWQPARPELRCSYTRRWLAAKATFRLAVTPPERQAIASMLAECG